MKSVYVFGLTRQAPPPLIVEGHRIEFIDVDGLRAAIEHGTAPPQVSPDALRAQHDIVMKIFEHVDDLLPARFGAWIDARELADRVGSQRAAILEAVNLVRGRAQMTVRFPPRPPAMGDAVDTVADRSSGTAYLHARRRMSRSMPAEATIVSAAVRDLLVAERVTPGSERSGAGLYHLIARGDVARYRKATARFHPPEVAVSGPWPAFAFAPDPWS